MKISILELLEGAAQASGITVIIDVFRAFTLEPLVLANDAMELYAVGEESIAWAMKEKDPQIILMGERHGRMIDGFDYGNSPSAIETVSFKNRRVVHTTSAGTKGLLAAKHADMLFAASLINAKATAGVIHQMNPDHVSLVCMGWEGKRSTEEDLLCAAYIRSLLLGEPMPDIKESALNLKNQEGKKFFDPSQAEIFPEADFWICTDVNRCNFAIQAVPVKGGYAMRKVRP